MDCYHEANKSHSHLFHRPFISVPKGKMYSDIELGTCTFNKLKSLRAVVMELFVLRHYEPLSERRW